MIVQLKMHATDKILGKICLRAIRDTFFPICCLWSGERQGDSVFWWGVISNGRGKFKLLGLQGDPQIPSLSGTCRYPHKENPEEGAWSTYCNDFKKK